eukprot:g2646.t1
MGRIHDLAAQNDVPGVKKLLASIVVAAEDREKGKDIAFRATLDRDHNGCPPLLWCAVFGHVEIAKELLRAMGLWRPGFHAAHELVEGHDLPQDAGLHERAARSALLAVDGKRGWTALHWAMARGDERMVSLLLDAGASLVALDGFQPPRTPLDIVQSILAEKARKRADTSFVPSGLSQAAGNHKRVYELVKHRLNAVAAQRAKEALRAKIAAEAAAEAGRMPQMPHLRREKDVFHIAKTANMDALHALLRQWQIEGDTALQKRLPGAEKGRYSSWISAPQSDGHTSGINCADVGGLTVLHWASKLGHAEIIRTLISRPPIGFGALIDRRVWESGQTALHLAAASGRVAAVEVLLWPEGRSGGDAINREAAMLVSGAAAFSQMSRYGKKAADKAAKNDPTEHVKPADPNVKDTVNDEAPLSMAATRGNLQVCRLLVEAGALVNNVDASGRSALHWAASEGHFKLVQYLLDNGADPRYRDRNGRDVAAWARFRSEHEVEEVLQNWNSLANAARRRQAQKLEADRRWKLVQKGVALHGRGARHDVEEALIFRRRLDVQNHHCKMI